MAIITIPITVQNKIASVECGTTIVADNTNYALEVEFDAEWAEQSVIIARFVCGTWVTERALVGNAVGVPMLPPDYESVKVGFYAGDLSTTSPASIRIIGSIMGQAPSIEDAKLAEIVRAEAERVAHEDERIEQELDRIAAEEGRVTAEEQRVSAEEAREAAETRREELARQMEQATEEAQNAAQNANTAAETANTAAQGASEATAAANEAAERAETAVSELGDIAERTEQAAASAASAAARAETAATNAEAATVNANSAAQAANTAAGSASTAAADANSAATAASTAATAANTAAAVANAAKEAATQAASAANTAADRAGTNADAAATAAQAANEASDRANNAAERTENALENFERSYATALLLNNSMPVAFRLFMEAMGEADSITALTERFFTIAAEMTEEVYASTFYRYSTSSSPVGWKEQDNAGLVCEPSTNAVAGRDDYAGLPLFACFDCNYTIDGTTLEPVIHAIKDVCGDFSSAPSDSFVGVLQMTGWVRRTQTTTTKTLEYAAYRKEDGFKPLPEAVRISDNSVRPFVIHAKYAAGWNSQGKLSSISGAAPVTNKPTAYGGMNASHNTQIARWRAWGNQYAGSSICDLAFLQTMLEIKYANLGSRNVMAGVQAYPYYQVQRTETDTTRVLVTPTAAAALIVGMAISIGTMALRDNAATYSVCPMARITAISNITMDDVEYGVVKTDAEDSFVFAEGNNYLVIQPWFTGATDDVRGNDGSPFDNRSGKEPFKLQGVEVIGITEILGDVVLYDVASQGYRVYANRRASNIGNNTGTGAVNIGMIVKANAGASVRNISELNWGGVPETYMFVKSSTAGTNPITTSYCAPLQQATYGAGGYYRSYRAIMSAQSTSYISLSGLAAMFGSNGATGAGDTVSWADSCRACGTAGNRGVYSE